MTNVSPLVRKGAILSLDPDHRHSARHDHAAVQPGHPDPLAEAAGGGRGAGPNRDPAAKGPPIETIKCDVEIDATDQLAAADPTAMSLGIQPQLSALELLVYPASTVLIANEVLSLLGTIEILPDGARR